MHKVQSDYLKIENQIETVTALVNYFSESLKDDDARYHDACSLRIELNNAKNEAEHRLFAWAAEQDSVFAHASKILRDDLVVNVSPRDRSGMFEYSIGCKLRQALIKAALKIPSEEKNASPPLENMRIGG